jgi:hypothetical protein
MTTHQSAGDVTEDGGGVAVKGVPPPAAAPRHVVQHITLADLGGAHVHVRDNLLEGLHNQGHARRTAPLEW